MCCTGFDSTALSLYECFGNWDFSLVYAFPDLSSIAFSLSSRSKYPFRKKVVKIAVCVQLC